eukprot:4547654-Alexandrium_andersonii.AAC.2
MIVVVRGLAWAPCLRWRVRAQSEGRMLATDASGWERGSASMALFVRCIVAPSLPCSCDEGRDQRWELTRPPVRCLEGNASMTA